MPTPRRKHRLGMVFEYPCRDATVPESKFITPSNASDRPIRGSLPLDRRRASGNRNRTQTLHHLHAVHRRHKYQRIPKTTTHSTTYPMIDAYCSTIFHRVPSAHPRAIKDPFHSALPTMV